MAPTETIGALVRIADTRVLPPAQIVAAAPRQGRRTAASRCGISDVNKSTLAAIQSMPIAERHSAAAGLGRSLRSRKRTSAPQANSEIRKGIRKNTASGSTLAVRVEATDGGKRGKRNAFERAAGLPGEHNQDRPEQVKLLLERKRPAMQQRQLVRRRGKILMGFPPVLNIRNRQKGVRAFLCHVEKHDGRAPQGSRQIGGRDGEDQGGINSSRSAHVKLTERKPSGLQVDKNIAGDEIAGNDKENIDADEASLKAVDLQVKQQDTR